MTGKTALKTDNPYLYVVLAHKMREIGLSHVGSKAKTLVIEGLQQGRADYPVLNGEACHGASAGFCPDCLNLVRSSVMDIEKRLNDAHFAP